MKSDNRGKWPCRLIVVFSLAMFAAPAVLAAPGDPLGPPFVVQSGSSGSFDYSPSVARSRRSGDFVVTWETVEVKSIGSSADVRARRYAANGTPLGSDFVVNTFVPIGDRYNPVVAMNDDGDFVVVWTNITTHGSVIWARRYGADGRAGLPILVGGADIGSYTMTPAVAMEKDGGFVVSWAQLPFPNHNLLKSSIHAQRFGARGLPLGPEALVDSVYYTETGLPHLAMAADGSFVVAWSRLDGSHCDSYVRRYSALNIADASRLVSGSQESALCDPAIAMTPVGAFVLVYSPGRIDNPSSVIMQRFDANAAPLGDSLQVAADGVTATAAMTPSGSVVVAWNAPADGSADFAQRYTADGSTLGGIIELNLPGEYISAPALAIADDGGFVAAWSKLDEDVEARLFSGN